MSANIILPEKLRAQQATFVLFPCFSSAVAGSSGTSDCDSRQSTFTGNTTNAAAIAFLCSRPTGALTIICELSEGKMSSCRGL